MGSFLSGGMVGEILLAPPSVSLTTEDNGDGYDIALGAMKFRIAPTNQNPYQRATAQFRKEQLDTGSSAGDNSLTGWWSRSQMSFHKGAGLKFYEVTGAETDFTGRDGTLIQNRYYSGVGCDVFSEPGQVTLVPEWVSAGSVPAPVNPTYALSAGGAELALLDGGTVKHGPYTYNPSPATVVSICAGGDYIFAARSDNKIQRLDATASSSTTIYTSTNPLIAVFYAKDRLFVVDNTHTWYQLAPNPSGALPVAIAAGDIVFTAASGPRGASWTLTDTTGPILIGGGERVFALTQDSSGAFVALSAPIQVMALPSNETVIELGAYLGYIVLVTSAGVRIGVISDGGQVNYGPLLVSWTSPPTATTIGRRGSSVYVAGDHRVIQIDLAQNLGNTLEFGFTDLPSPFTGAEARYGVLSWGSDLAVWGGTVLDQWSTMRNPTGTLRTAFHRFGTMEPKFFSSVTVRIDGDGGTVVVKRVNVDGTVVPLYTIDAATSHVETLDLGMTSAQEMLALEFELKRDPGDIDRGPTLLGYQIKAMPAPARSRMIRVPLLIHDVTRRQAAGSTGHLGAAWEQLSLLEDLEATNAMVRYQDFRTGETCDVFIESIEFQNTTPPSAGSSGFGGYAFVTLRKLR